MNIGNEPSVALLRLSLLRLLCKHVSTESKLETYSAEVGLNAIK